MEIREDGEYFKTPNSTFFCTRTRKNTNQTNSTLFRYFI